MRHRQNKRKKEIIAIIIIDATTPKTHEYSRLKRSGFQAHGEKAYIT